MTEFLLTLKRSLTSLTSGRIWLYMLIPSLLALLLMSALAAFALDWLVATLSDQPPMRWISAWGALWLAHALAWLGGWLSILSVSYLLAVLLTSVLVMPLLLVWFGGRWMARLKRGKPENWLWQRLETKKRRLGMGNPKLIVDARGWSVKRNRRAS